MMLRCSVATDARDVVAAWSLVHEQYRRLGLIESQPGGIFYHQQACGEQARVVICKNEAGLVLGTVTLIWDSWRYSYGLPLDDVYARLITERFRDVAILVEVCLLAVVRKSVLPILLDFAWNVVVSTGATLVLMGVHPRHAPYYKRVWGFKRFGCRTRHPGLCGNVPVVGMYRELPRIDWDAVHDYACSGDVDGIAGGPAGRLCGARCQPSHGADSQVDAGS